MLLLLDGCTLSGLHSQPLMKDIEKTKGRPKGGLRPSCQRGMFGLGYLISTVAPASANFFLMFSASSFDTPSLTGFGAPSTRSLASFNPRLVISRTALMTPILLPPTAVRMTLNSVFSSAGAAAAAPPAAGAAPATATLAAAALTPKVSSRPFTSSEASSSDNPLISSIMLCTLDIAISY